MANLVVKDGTNATKHIAQTGAGTDLDPFVRLVTGPLTDAQLRAADVAVTLAGESVAVTGTVTVAGGLTDAELRAAPVPVSGPLTDAQLRAVAVPVSGTVAVSGAVATTGGLTDTQLRAAAVPVSGTVTANPPTPTLTTLSGVCALLGPNTVVAAPAAGNHHLLYSFQFQARDAPTAKQIVLLMDGAIERWNFSTTYVDGAIIIFFPEGQELPFASATAIVLDLAEAKSVSYVLRYRTVAD